MPGAARTTALPDQLTYYFDPGCPWTWATTLWLDHVAERRSIPLRWRTFSVALLHDDAPEDEPLDPKLAAVRQVLRLLAAVGAAGDETLVRAVYLEFGRRFHVEREQSGAELVRSVADTAGAGDHRDAVDDDRWDEQVATSTREALDLVGNDVGSPIIAMDEPAVGLFGPILSPAPSGAEADDLLDLVVAAARTSTLFELKRGRTSRPAKRLGAPEAPA